MHDCDVCGEITLGEPRCEGCRNEAIRRREARMAEMRENARLAAMARSRRLAAA